MTNQNGFRIPEVVPRPQVEAEGVWSRIRVSEVVDPKDIPRSRTRADGATRLNSLASKDFHNVGKIRNEESFFPWAVIDERKDTGTWCMIPAKEDDPDKIAIRWEENGTIATFSLAKVLAAKGIRVDKGTCMVIECRIGPASDGQPGLELLFPERWTEPQRRGGRKQSTPVATVRGARADSPEKPEPKT